MDEFAGLIFVVHDFKKQLTQWHGPNFGIGNCFQQNFPPDISGCFWSPESHRNMVAMNTRRHIPRAALLCSPPGLGDTLDLAFIRLRESGPLGNPQTVYLKD